MCFLGMCRHSACFGNMRREEDILLPRTFYTVALRPTLGREMMMDDRLSYGGIYSCAKNDYIILSRYGLMLDVMLEMDKGFCFNGRRTSRSRVSLWSCELRFARPVKIRSGSEQGSIAKLARRQ